MCWGWTLFYTFITKYYILSNNNYIMVKYFRWRSILINLYRYLYYNVLSIMQSLACPWAHFVLIIKACYNKLTLRVRQILLYEISFNSYALQDYVKVKLKVYYMKWVYQRVTVIRYICMILDRFRYMFVYSLFK